MFTIKYVRDKAALITEAQEVSLAKPGSPQYEAALALAEEYGLSKPDLIQTFKTEARPTSGMLGLLFRKQPGSYVLTTEREGQPGKPVAVILSDALDPNLPDVPGNSYQFVYDGEAAFIMNRYGQTVELIRR